MATQPTEADVDQSDSKTSTTSDSKPSANAEQPEGNTVVDFGKHKGKSFKILLDNHKYWCYQFLLQNANKVLDSSALSENESRLYNYLIARCFGLNPSIKKKYQTMLDSLTSSPNPASNASDRKQSQSVLLPPSMRTDIYWILCENEQQMEQKSEKSDTSTNYAYHHKAGKWMLFVDKMFVWESEKSTEQTESNNQSADDTCAENEAKNELDSNIVTEVKYFALITELDHVWQKVEYLTRSGLLGSIGAKVSTSKPNPNARKDSNDGVIIIYTLDYSDKEDVLKVAKNIRKYFPDYKGDLRYKADFQTRAGHYSNRGQKSSLYLHKANSPDTLFDA